MKRRHEDSPSLLVLIFWMLVVAVGAAATVPVLHSVFVFPHLRLRGLAWLEVLAGPGTSAWLVWLPIPLLIVVWVLWERLRHGTRLRRTNRGRAHERPTPQ
jgi:hypothetical protein